MYIYPYKNRIDKIHAHKHTKLYREAEEIGEEAREGRYESREIYLAEDGAVGLEGGGDFVEALCEVVPKADSREVEKGLWDSVGGDMCYAGEYDDIY